ncbi:hypothetical protein EsHS_00005319 [Epichloe bromicola]
MQKKRLRQLNGPTAGGLNTLTNPPRSSASSYSPSESPRSKRHKPDITSPDPRDPIYSRYFATPERHGADETHDLTLSGSQEDLHENKSDSSTGKSKTVRAAVGEFRSTQPNNSCYPEKNRARRSWSNSCRHRLLGTARKSEGNNPDTPGRLKKSGSLESPDVLGEDDPPPATICSDIVRAWPKRSRPASRPETTSPHFKRPRVHQSIESIESEDELSKDQHGGSRRTNFSDLATPKRTSSRGDILPTQFLKSQPKPSGTTEYKGVPPLYVRRAVCGKHTYATPGGKQKLFLKQDRDDSLLLLPQNAEGPLDWLAIDLENVTKMQHACTESHLVHVTRPRSNNGGYSLWLEFMDHRDVLRLIGSASPTQLAELPVKELKIKWKQAWDKATNYQDQMHVKSSDSLPTISQYVEEIAPKDRRTDKDDTVNGSRRPVKLVDQMQDSTRTEQNLSIEASREEVSTVAKAPSTRRTRRSSPVYVPREASPERWTSQNPDWRAQWYQSLVFPATGRNRATVDDGDIPRLDEGEFLNDNLISFYIRYLQFKLENEKPELLSKIYFFSTFFFEKLRSTKGKINFEGVKAWTAKFDLLSYDYIVVPVNENAHWYLAVICNTPNAVHGIPHGGDQDNSERVDESSPRIAAIEQNMSDVTIRDGDTKQLSVDVEIVHSPPSSARTMQNSSPGLKTTTTAGSQISPAAPRHDDPRTPKIITLDSLASPHSATCKALREYLIAEAKDKKGVDLVKVPNGMTAKRIPEQDNFCDCGVFILGYMEEFLKDPDGTVRKLLQREYLGWNIRPSQLRKSLRELLFKLQHEQHERHENERAEKRLLSAKRTSLAKNANFSTPSVDRDISPTLGRESSATELPDASDVVMVSKPAPFATEAVVKDDARSSEPEAVASSPTKRCSKDRAALFEGPQADLSTDNNKRRATSVRESSLLLTRHELVKDALGETEVRRPIALTSSPPRHTKKQDLVETLPISSSEAEVQVTRATPKQTKRTSIESADVEEVMSISRNRATRQRSKQLDSSPSLIQPLRSSQSLSPEKLQAKYDGIERSVDLT